MTTFEDFGLGAPLLRAIAELGYNTPTPIQSAAIPVLLQGRDVLGQAQTGTGKTAAFALPLLQRLDTRVQAIQALILTPTRELALQVSEAIHQYGQYLGARVLPIYGGQSYSRQKARLEKGAHIVVGTPGRTLDLINLGVLDLSAVSYAVLDEADEMLKMGFIEDVQTILSYVPHDRQTALFSATLAKPIRELAENYMRAPEFISVRREEVTVAEIEQRYYLVHPDTKIQALSRLLETEDLQSALIFTRTRAASGDLAAALLERGYVADALNGELSQAAREAVLRRFRNGQLPILVATDVVARGVDISGVSHVFNFDMPYDPEDYVHRIGRTGRAGRSGIAITLVTPRERARLSRIEQFIKQRIPAVELPKLEVVRAKRDQQFSAALALEAEAITPEDRQLVADLVAQGWTIEQIAAAAMRLARADERQRPIDHVKSVKEPAPRERESAKTPQRRKMLRDGQHEHGMVRLWINAGESDGLRPRDVVGTIANMSGIPGKAIGAITIEPNKTYVDVKDSHVEQVLRGMKRWRLRGRALQLTRMN